MIDVIIIGAGGHSAEIDEYIIHSQKTKGIEEIRISGFLDDNPASYAAYEFSAPFIGSLKEHKILKDHFYIIGIANLNYRRIFIDKFTAEGAKFISFFHVNAYISPSAIIGEGTIIGPHVNVGPNAILGSYNLINSRCSLGHDTQIGSYNFISPNVCFSGFTKIGDENLFGINAATIPGISVGNKNKIAAGMVLDQNVGDDSIVFYRFKERIIAIPR